MNDLEDNSIATRFFDTLDPSVIKIIKHPVQFDFWKSEEESEIEAMSKRVDALHTTTHKVRRSYFCELGGLKRRVAELEDRLAILERHICKN